MPMSNGGETDIGVSLTAKSDGDKSAVSGFSYGQWLATGQSSGDESWTSGTFILKAASGDIYRSRLSAAWRDVGARALNIQPLLRDELLLRANNRDGNWQSAWKTIVKRCCWLGGRHKRCAFRRGIGSRENARMGSPFRC